MIRNCATNDEDFVPPTKYPKLSRRMKDKPPPAPKPRLTVNLYLSTIKIPIAPQSFYTISIPAIPIKYLSRFGLTSSWISLWSIFEALYEPQVHGRTPYRQRTQLFN